MKDESAKITQYSSDENSQSADLYLTTPAVNNLSEFPPPNFSMYSSYGIQPTIHDALQLFQCDLEAVLSYLSIVAKKYTQARFDQQKFIDQISLVYCRSDIELISKKYFSLLIDMGVENKLSEIISSITSDGEIILFNIFNSNCYKCSLIDKKAFQDLVKNRLGSNWKPQYSLNTAIFYYLMRAKKEINYESKKVGNLALILQVTENTTILLLSKGKILKTAIEKYAERKGFGSLLIYKRVKTKMINFIAPIGKNSIVLLKMSEIAKNCNVQGIRNANWSWLMNSEWPQVIIDVIGKGLLLLRQKKKKKYIDYAAQHIMDVDRDGIVTISDLIVSARMLDVYKVLYYALASFASNNRQTRQSVQICLKMYNSCTIHLLISLFQVFGKTIFYKQHKYFQNLQQTQALFGFQQVQININELIIIAEEEYSIQSLAITCATLPPAYKQLHRVISSNTKSVHYVLSQRQTYKSVQYKQQRKLSMSPAQAASYLY